MWNLYSIAHRGYGRASKTTSQHCTTPSKQLKHPTLGIVVDDDDDQNGKGQSSRGFSYKASENYFPAHWAVHPSTHNIASNDGPFRFPLWAVDVGRSDGPNECPPASPGLSIVFCIGNIFLCIHATGSCKSNNNNTHNNNNNNIRQRDQELASERGTTIKMYRVIMCWPWIRGCE